MSMKSLSKYFVSVNLAAVMFSLGAQPSNGLSLGKISTPKQATCPSNFLTGMTCYTATISRCVDYLNHTLPSYSLTFGITPEPSNPKGLIVLHSGGGGTAPYDLPGSTNYFASDYKAANYQVVQLAWSTSLAGWEATGISNEYDLKGAACRPATFFNYIYKTYYLPMHTGVGGPGYCLQGHSGGSMAIAYYLAEYGGQNTVDKALLSAGPQAGDMQQGCEVPQFPPVTGCPGGATYPCAAGVQPWTFGPQYTAAEVSWDAGGGRDNGINAACNNSHNIPTTLNSNWKNMSIVDGLSDSVFVYPATNISGYLCTNTNLNYQDGSVNPSSEQGWIFYSQIPATDIHGLTVHSATCWSTKGGSTADPEQVYYATEIDGNTTPPNFGPLICNHATGVANYSTGYAAMCNDMINTGSALH